MPLYAVDGSINVTAVSGTSFVGRYAANGSLNVVEHTGSTYVGLHHPSGAFNVKVVTGSARVPVQDPTGALNVYIGTPSAAAALGGPMPVTVVSGGLGSVASTLLGAYTDGLAIGFTDASLVIKDTVTPSNAFSGVPRSKLTYSSPSVKRCRQSDGSLKNGAHNLALRSEDLSNATWGKTRTTATADTITEDSTAASTHYVSQTITGLVVGRAYEARAELKAGTRSWAWLWFDGKGYFFNLATGTVGSLVISASDAVSITASTDGYYTCTVRVNSVSTANPSFWIGMGPADNTISYDGNGTGTIQARKMHVREYPAVDTYLATTSAVVYELPYEWDASGNALGIRVEEQRTNLCIRSDFSSGWAWYIAGTTTTGAAVAPDGTTTAVEANCGATNNYHTFYQSSAISFTNATTYTASVWLKYKDHRYVGLRATKAATTGQTWVIADMLNGTIAFTGSAITSATLETWANGWYRLIATYTATATASDSFAIGLFPDASAPTNEGGTVWNGTSTGVYVWGPQLEVGAFATSYIPTTSATVTRAVDNISIATSLFPYSATAGSIFTKQAPLADPSTFGAFNRYLELFKDVNDRIIFQSISSSAFTFFVTSGGVTQASVNSISVAGALSAGTVGRLAGGYAVNNFNKAINGTVDTADVSGALPAAATTLTFGAGTGGASSRHVRNLLYIPQRVTDAELGTINP